MSIVLQSASIPWLQPHPCAKNVSSDLARPEKYRRKSLLIGNDSIVQSGQEDDYNKLVEDIRYIVSMSPCITQLDERCVPMDYLIHGHLEQVCNYEKRPYHNAWSELCDLATKPARNERVSAKPPIDDGFRVQKHGRGRKTKGARTRRYNSNKQPEDSDDGDFEDDEDNSEGEGEPSDQSVCETDLQQQFSCTFRKRDPTRFNVRDHQRCALRGFKDLALLKCETQVIPSFSQTMNRDADILLGATSSSATVFLPRRKTVATDAMPHLRAKRDWLTI